MGSCGRERWGWEEGGVSCATPPPASQIIQMARDTGMRGLRGGGIIREQKRGGGGRKRGISSGENPTVRTTGVNAALTPRRIPPPLSAGSRGPGWGAKIVPRDLLVTEEEAWNSYPDSKTVYRNAYLGDSFSMVVLSKYVDDRGETENVSQHPC